MGFKDRFFQESVEKSQIEKNDKEIAKSDSSLTKLGQILDKFRSGKTDSSSIVANDYKASSDYTPTESDGSVGVGIPFTPKEEFKTVFDDIDSNNGNNIEESLEVSTETERKTVCFEKNGIRYEVDNNTISEKEIGEIFDVELEEPGYISGKVMDYDDTTYQKEGIHRVNWKPDAAEGTTKNIVLEASDSPIICQWSHPNETGSYFCDPDTKYENLQLQDIQEKREQKYYEVIKDLPMEKSVINDQHFLDGVSFDKTYQYVSALMNEQGKPMTAKELVEAGYLKEITCIEGNK